MSEVMQEMPRYECHKLMTADMVKRNPKKANAKIRGAGTASAGLPGCAAKTTENK